MKKPPEIPPNFCMAPFVHTFISPQSERRLCCASREPAQNFKQYIDVSDGLGTYTPKTLDEHWNSSHMMSVRKRMMNGEVLPECEVCNNKLLNTDVYRDYFWHLFKHHYDNVWDHTEEDGFTYMKPVSWDYRFSNLCNFKCRMCGDMLSSAWESEEKKYGMVDFSNPKNNWMIPRVRDQIENFQTGQVAKEFEDAIEDGRIEEVYWVGGEPLMFEEHWKYMKRVVELGHGSQLYARYNTNLSRIQYKGTHLFKDILPNIRDWQICASIDGTGAIGEYIRDGLDWNVFLDNFKEGMKIAYHPRQMRLDFTITLPGLFELKNMFDLSKELNVTILTKVVFAFSPDIIMSPLALPRGILVVILNDFLEYANKQGISPHQQPLIDVINNLYTRQTFYEQFPDTVREGLHAGKKRMQKIDTIRNGLTLPEILKQDRMVYEWYNEIS